ncbi:MAG: hypothetical protein V1495_00130 [Pseudomonadota bacterium]
MKRTTKSLIEALMVAIVLSTGVAQAQEERSMLARLKTIAMDVESATVDSITVEPTRTFERPSDEDVAFQTEVRENVSSIYRCVEQRRSIGAGRVRVAFTVLSSGHLSNVHVAVRFPQTEPAVVRCVRDALHRSRIENTQDQERQFQFTFAFAGATQVSF